MNHASGSLLAGLLFDETGDRLTPSQATKDGKRYCYYISQRLMQARKKYPSGWRIPAHELDTPVLCSLRGLLEDQNRLYHFLNLRDASMEVMRTTEHNALMLARLLAGSSSEARAALLNLVARIDIASGELMITFAPGGPHRELGIAGRSEQGEGQSSESSDGLLLALPFDMRRRGMEARLIVGCVPQQPDRVDDGLVDAISRFT